MIMADQSYAVYRLPDSNTISCLDSGQVKILHSLDEVGEYSGFLIAPFTTTPRTPIILIPAGQAHQEDIPKAQIPLTEPSCKEAEPDDTYRESFEKFHNAVSDGTFTKLVLSRTKEVKLTEGTSPKDVFLNLCRTYPHLMIILFHTPQTGTWIAATPEILFERKDGACHTVALAGTMTGDVNDSQWSDKCRAEQNVVEKYISEILERQKVDIIRKEGPHTSRAGRLSHLKTDIWFRADEGQTGTILSALHPTPAVCGIPAGQAQAFITAREVLDREYFSGFAGPVGMNGRTHLYVLLRCAHLSSDHRTATLYAGGGIMPQSDCISEFRETEHKMETIGRCLINQTLRFRLEEKTLHFKKPARTSRGAYSEHRMLQITLTDGFRTGTGECAPLPDLSCDRDAYDDIEQVSSLIRESIAGCSGYREAADNIAARLKDYPALRFALESAAAELYRSEELYGTPFAAGEETIPINGLVWMSDFDDMMRQAQEKIDAGFTTVKFKIGSIEWDRELEMIRRIRARFSAEYLTIRVDANGAFTPEEAPHRLEELSKFDLHSIEQPIRQGQWEEMTRLCASTPLPIALDEELIGVNDLSRKRELLDTIRPQFIVVKPTLHGGLSGAREWIREAYERGIGSWITSALESNIGLNSISLLAASIYGSGDSVPAQGLGTGQLFTDNIDLGIEIINGSLRLSRGVE